MLPACGNTSSPTKASPRPRHRSPAGTCSSSWPDSCPPGHRPPTGKSRWPLPAWCERVAEALLTSDTNLLVALGPTRGNLTQVDVIRRSDGKVVPVDPGERRYSTKGLLLTEQHAINRSLARHDAQAGTARPRMLEHALRRRTLTDEQERMVRRLTSSRAGVEVVVGKAGTGKTYALDAARDVWESSGIRVTGVALAARAALELQASAGIRATTLARLLGQLDDHRDTSPLEPGRCWWWTRQGWSAPDSSPASSTTPKPSPSRS